MQKKKHRRTAAGFVAATAAASLTVGVLGISPAGATVPRGLAFVSKNTLHVVTFPGSNNVALRLTPGAPSTLEVDFNDDGRADVRTDRNRFNTIVVSLGSGNDSFRIDQVNGTFADEAVTIDGGSGNDTLNGGDTIERFFGGSGNDLADGNRGNDSAFLGSGNDVFRWDPGDGSDLVEGQSGTDTMDFNGAPGVENMQLIPNGVRSKFLRDAGNITMDMGSVEQLDLTAVGGIDSVRIADMTGTGFRRALVDLGDPGAAPDDTVTVEGTPRADRVDVRTSNGNVVVGGLTTEVTVSRSDVADSLKVNTVAGDDTVNVANDVATRITPTVDLGADEV